MCEITMEQVRDMYPNPVTATSCLKSNKLNYCIGGALINFLQDKVTGYVPLKSFGTTSEIAAALCAANSHLSSKQAYDRARRIIEANDGRRFNLAWKRLDAALKYGCIAHFNGLL